MAASLKWVFLVYRLPREPSTPRIALWRRLRRLGVVQIADGVVALPLDARTKGIPATAVSVVCLSGISRPARYPPSAVMTTGDSGSSARPARHSASRDIVRAWRRPTIASSCRSKMAGMTANGAIESCGASETE